MCPAMKFSGTSVMMVADTSAPTTSAPPTERGNTTNPLWNARRHHGCPFSSNSGSGSGMSSGWSRSTASTAQPQATPEISAARGRETANNPPINP